MVKLLTRLLPCLPRTHRNQLIFIYALDWLTIIALAGATFAINKIKPFHREFSLNDKTISHIHKEDLISEKMLAVIAGVIPLACILIIGLGIRRSVKDAHHGLLGLGLSITMTLVITVAFKITVGRLRPDWMSRCLPKAGSVDPPFGLSNYTVCTRQDGFIFLDGMKSFPSGHSSTAHAGLGFFSLYLAGKLHVFDGKAYTIRGFIAVFPLIGAGLIAVSRTTDYRHHWQDVLVGAFIGLASAYFAYRQFYPTLESHDCARPLPINRLLEAADLSSSPDVRLAAHPATNAVTAVPAMPAADSANGKHAVRYEHALASGSSLASPPHTTTAYPPGQSSYGASGSNLGYQQRSDRDRDHVAVSFQ